MQEGYGGMRVLDGADIRRGGEMHVLVGENGTGKPTLLSQELSGPALP